MAVALVSQDARATTGTTVSFSYTSGSGTDRLFFAATRRAGGGTVDSASYAGASLTNSSTQGDLKFWNKTAPATGANTASFTLSAYGSCQTSISDWTGVDQTTPLGTAVTATGTSTSASTGSVTVPTDGAAIGGMSTTYVSGSAPTAGSGTTLVGSYRSGGGGSAIATGYRTTTGSVTFSHNSCTWNAMGVPVNAAGAGGGLSANPMRGGGAASGPLWGYL